MITDVGTENKSYDTFISLKYFQNVALICTINKYKYNINIK